MADGKSMITFYAALKISRALQSHQEVGKYYLGWSKPFTDLLENCAGTMGLRLPITAKTSQLQTETTYALF
ncbi:hypothetical protein KCP73_01825 [Salmonella enterica subsp. enterica]|nr:hypothetical protein KCP73_01825 [Salmonella enterica subsp. enterica]